MSFVRQSKFRHVFGKARKPEQGYGNLRPSKTAWDTNFVEANSKYLGLIWDQAGGGAFAIWPHERVGKLPSDVPLFQGHTGPILDLAFHPFNEQLVASASEDCKIRLWQIPEGEITENVRDSVQLLKGHQRKVGNIIFHPTAANVLASSSPDNTIRLWDVENGEEKFKFAEHKDMVQSMCFNYDGSLMVSTAKDKKIRIIDNRQNSCAEEAEGFPGLKGSRAIWLGKLDKIFAVGFSRTSDRLLALYDPRKMGEKITSLNIDTSAGVLMPFHDEDTGMVYLAGKGDGNIRYYEVIDTKPFVPLLSEYKSNVPQKGMGVLPKASMDILSCEVMRFMKLTKDSIEPIEFHVPRKSDQFQEDIFPDTRLNEPAMTSEEWFGGENKPPKLTSLEDGFQAAMAQALEFKKQAEPEVVKAKSNEEKLNDKIKELEADKAALAAKVKELEAKPNVKQYVS